MTIKITIVPSKCHFYSLKAALLQGNQMLPSEVIVETAKVALSRPIGSRCSWSFGHHECR